MFENQLPNEITTPEEMPHPLLCNPMDAEWKARITDKWWAQGFTGEDKLSPTEKIHIARNRPLIKKILEFGGEEVCMPLIEDDIDAILERSVFLYGDDAEMCPGAPSQCHANSADLWSQSVHTRMGLMTGYALSKDGMWRQHSWCVYLETGQVIETTESRLAYYGFVMTEEEALSFTSDNY